MYLIYLIAPLIFLWSRRFAPILVYWSSASAPYMVLRNVLIAPIVVYWSSGFAPRTSFLLNLDCFGLPLSGNFSTYDLILSDWDKLLIFNRQVP